MTYPFLHMYILYRLIKTSRYSYLTCGSFLYFSLFNYWWTEHKTWCQTCSQSLCQSSGWGCPRPPASGTLPAPRWSTPRHSRLWCSRCGVVSHSSSGLHSCKYRHWYTRRGHCRHNNWMLSGRPRHGGQWTLLKHGKYLNTIKINKVKYSNLFSAKGA